MNNLHYLVGDRFLCNEKKNQIISKLSEKESWEIKIIDEKMSASKFLWSLQSKDVFGNQRKIFVIDENLPEPHNDLISIFESIPSKKHVIVIQKNTPQKNTKFYKAMKETIEEFPSMYTDRGFLDKKSIPKAKKKIKEISSWSGSEDCLDFIMDRADYEYGAILNEIEKVYTFLERYPNNVGEIEDIVCDDNTLRVDEITKEINNRNIIGALVSARTLVDSDSFDQQFMLFLSNLSENFNFIMHCKMAHESGISDQSAVASFVSNNWIKNGKNVPSQMIFGRYFFFKDYFDKWSVDDAMNALKKTEEAMTGCILHKASPAFIINNLIMNII